MKKNKWLIAMVVVILIGIAFLISYKMQNKSSDDAIRIGVILPLTGKYADNGMSVKCGIALAIKELNEANIGDKYDVFFYDTKSESKNATIGYNQLRSLYGINIIVTTMSDNSLILKPLAIQDKVLLFCVASHSDIVVNNGRMVFRTCNTGAEEAQCISDYIVNHVKNRHVFLYSFNTQAGNDCKKVIEQNFKKELVGTCVYDDGNYQVLKSISNSGIYKNANCIIVIGYSPYMGALIKSIRDNGFRGDIFSNVGFNNPSVIGAAGDAAKTVRFVDYAFPYGTKADYSRNRWSEEELGEPFSAMSYFSYGVMKLISRVCLEHPSIKNNLLELGNYLVVDKKWQINDLLFMSHVNGSFTTGLVIRELD